ncbi:LysM peptidoglycan-binding domain-containing protein [Nitrosomonas supralitoralis]|uniref:Peptidoglycan-binding protein LysM n=1 Tax=Nitrosomonas supralitoralis TaxID=2116706 RepID=A0A2P7NUV9_9PROT|nr:LysM peptidoglycan-binding domain-containing protein [Nitrosomonas supralitoralis]PSJ17253.1 peptidoglycan-binding protein LysM [Nitrosomonas supralitoralis]
MRKPIIAMILFLSLLSIPPANAENNILRSDTPYRHVVVPGDTLWGIASRFLNDPWRWPEIWGLNREQVKNPHKIYPGDAVILKRTPYGYRLSLEDPEDGIKTVKLSPKIRSELSDTAAIPSIPAAAIEPFLTQPLVIEKDGLDTAPYILGSSDNRVVLSTGNTAYISGLPNDKGSAWQIFRPGNALKDPDQKDRILGYEATYLGNAKASLFADVSTVTITRATEEILNGDRLVPSPDNIFNNYAPHAPDFPINGRIISVYGGVTEIGKDSIITLNKGKMDGLEMGHVLAVYRKSQAKSLDGETVQLPEERTGLAFVFRVFDKIAYALVVQSTHSIKLLDAVKTP